MFEGVGDEKNKKSLDLKFQEAKEIHDRDLSNNFNNNVDNRSDCSSRGTTITTANLTTSSSSSSSSSSSDQNFQDWDQDYPFGIVVPKDFSDQQRNELQRDIDSLWQLQIQRKLQPSQNQAKDKVLKKQINDLFDKWQPQGVITDPAFINQAKEARRKAEADSAKAKQLEALYEKALGYQDDFTLYFHRCSDFGVAAKMATEAWQEVARLHQFIPGPFSGVILQKRWNDKLLDCQRAQEEMKQKLVNKTEVLLECTTKTFDSLKKRQGEFTSAKNWNKVAEVGEAWQRMGLLQKVIQKNLSSFLKKSSSQSSSSSSLSSGMIFHDPKMLLALDVAREALEATMHEAEQAMTFTEPGQYDDEDARTTNESLLRTLTAVRTPTEKSSPQENELFQMILQFREHVDLVKKYSEELFSIADAADRIMSRGDVEFMDPTDANCLTAAHQELEVVLVFLDAVLYKMEASSEDLFSLEKKKDYALEVTQGAIEHLCSAIEVLENEKKYDKTEEVVELLEELRQLKSKNPIFKN